jgi:hypothetical protein
MSSRDEHTGDLTAIITRTLFAVVQTTSYPELLTRGSGSLLTRDGYTTLFDSLDGELAVPWRSPRRSAHWSRFWAHYLAKPGRMRDLSADVAWDRIVPFCWLHPFPVSGPADTDVTVEVLVYPSSIAVVIEVDAAGEWPLAGLAEQLSSMRDAKHWRLETSDSSGNRSLDGIATTARDAAARLLADGASPEPGTPEVHTVVAPISGKGDLARFDLSDETTRSCLAGLATLGPPGKLLENRLLEENSNTRHGARTYALSEGHVIWHPRHILRPPEDDPIGCLFHNHIHLVAHIAALGSVVTWANDRRTVPGGIGVAVQPLVQRAADRLLQLHEGRKDKTYRSGLAKARIEPMLETVKVVARALE